MTTQVRIINNEPWGGDSILVITLDPGTKLDSPRIVRSEVRVPPGGNTLVWLSQGIQAVVCQAPASGHVETDDMSGQP